MEKKNKGKTIVIVILILAVLGLGGYIVYDKFLNTEIDEDVNIQKKQEINLLSKEEALKIGKDRYEYIRDGLYACLSKNIEVDSNKGIDIIDGVITLAVIY